MPMTRIATGFIVLGGLLVLTFQAAQWYADNSLLPRYCENPERHLALVRQILNGDTPSGETSRRPYIIAAKIIYLVPRGPAEPMAAYLRRARMRIDDTCR